MKKIVQTQNYSNLITDLASLIEQWRKTVVRVCHIQDNNGGESTWIGELEVR